MKGGRLRAGERTLGSPTGPPREGPSAASLMGPSAWVSWGPCCQGNGVLNPNTRSQEGPPRKTTSWLWAGAGLRRRDYF